MLGYIALGLSLGFSSGISPGPLLALVIAASLRNGLAGGLRVAFSPFITDAPIITLALLLLNRLPAAALRWVGIAGGLVVIWLGIDILRSSRHAQLPEGGGSADAGRELWRGAAVNALNPHPYLFWTTVGGPTLLTAWQQSPWRAVGFLGGFYLMLVGSKVLIAWLVSRQAGGLSLPWYRRILTGCGLLMVGLGCWIIYQAL